MRIVSLVPSWTETLIEAGLNVVGRTRFCVHPSERVQDIAIVGGTKKVDWQKVSELAPDLIIMDREENTKEMAEACPFPFWASHVTSVSDMPSEIRRLNELLKSEKLKELAVRWANFPKKNLDFKDLMVEEWIQEPTGHETKLLYVIWREPWMVVSKETFIGSVLSHLGLGKYLLSFDKKYPEIQLENFDVEDTVLLFSSEPYPFHKKKEEIEKLGFASAIVDGEAYSWFGLRSLTLLSQIGDL